MLMAHFKTMIKKRILYEESKAFQPPKIEHGKIDACFAEDE